MLQENKALKLELEDARKELSEANKKIKEFAKTQKKEKEMVLERMREIEQNYQKYATYYSKFMDMKNQCDEKDE
jgi:regulator of replication initiation timing